MPFPEDLGGAGCAVSGGGEMAAPAGPRPAKGPPSPAAAPSFPPAPATLSRPSAHAPQERFKAGAAAGGGVVAV